MSCLNYFNRIYFPFGNTVYFNRRVYFIYQGAFSSPAAKQKPFIRIEFITFIRIVKYIYRIGYIRLGYEITPVIRHLYIYIPTYIYIFSISIYRKNDLYQI